MKYHFHISSLLLFLSTLFCGLDVPAQDELCLELRIMADRCEAAYLQGDILQLSSSLAEFKSCMDTDSSALVQAGDKKEFEGLYFKFLSNLDYLQADYNSAVSHINKSLSYAGNQSTETRLNMYVDKAQYHFMLSDFRSAAASLREACRITETCDTITDSTYSECRSAYALSLAYCGYFDEAEEQMKETEHEVSSGILSPVRAQERDRRKAKIQLLKAESKTAPTSEDYKDAKSVYEGYFRHRKLEIVGKFSLMTAREREGFWLTQRQFIVDCYRFEEFAPELVYDAALFNKNLLLQFSARNSEFKSYEWKDVRRCLPDSSAAVEFIQYRRDSAIYLGAAVVTEECKSPEFIHIGRTEEILRHTLKDGLTVKAALIADYRDAKNELYSNRELMGIIWNKELRNVIKGCSDVYFSADGFLHQLAIEYLYPEEDAPRFHRLTSTRSICRGCSPVKVEDSAALICGDIDFQVRLQDSTDLRNDETAFENLVKKKLSFFDLDGSKREIDSICSIRTRYRDSVLTRMKATEQAFRKVAGEYRIVHISTHGYYDGHMDVPVENLTPQRTDNILSQSVIFFSGSNANLHDASFSPVGQPDGIVSAREMSELDLSKVSLCVLAACQTGLGDVTADGVYGIQRGLKNAGAGAMVLSLWNVDDLATSIMMSSLYLHLAEGFNIHQAFNRSIEDLRKEVVTTSARHIPGKMTHKSVRRSLSLDEPFYRNAFILIDDIN